MVGEGGVVSGFGVVRNREAISKYILSNRYGGTTHVYTVGWELPNPEIAVEIRYVGVKLWFKYFGYNTTENRWSGTNNF